ncbi:MAG: arginine--tRNA ligase [Parasphingorhabdus sp.]|uniref:arginine--tRNA ligase n=1 Tax=Parasphingorhabdus sp. TaxID=2709688 RepID=UPI003297DDB8
MLFHIFQKHIDQALDDLVASGDLPADLDRKNITLEPPRDSSHGDLSTNAAMVLSKAAGEKPRDLAIKIVEKLSGLDDIRSAEIAGPGFINLKVSDAVLLAELKEIETLGTDYGRSTKGSGVTVNVEYVSANPTGPMHMGHCRGAVVGDALADLLAFIGYKVIREYYVNDAGAQVDILAQSAHIRYREALGEAISDIPEGLYPGDYLKPLGSALAQEYGDKYRDAPQESWLPIFRKAAVAGMMDMIRADLSLLGIQHDVFSSEAELHAAGKADAAEAELRARDLIYDGVLEKPKGKTIEDWEAVELPLFRSTQFGDDQDRPIKKSNGQWTYFGGDLAYHFQKAQKADELIDIWGADHSGTVKRIKAAVSALTRGETKFDVKLIQMVRLLRNGEPEKMSKRSGNFVTIADMVEEVGKDAVRFTMLTRKADAQMDFDFAKVTEASRDNPVFYVQYAHARIQSTLRKAADEDILPSDEHLAKLGPEELDLVKQAAQFPRIVESAAVSREPHRIAFYLNDLAAAFHAFWNMGNDHPEMRIIMVNDPAMTSARLFLAKYLGQVIKNGLALMGVSAADKM